MLHCQLDLILNSLNVQSPLQRYLKELYMLLKSGTTLGVAASKSTPQCQCLVFWLNVASSLKLRGQNLKDSM